MYILGVGGSGKSTILTVMENLFATGTGLLPPSERRSLANLADKDIVIVIATVIGSGHGRVKRSTSRASSRT